MPQRARAVVLPPMTCLRVSQESRKFLDCMKYHRERTHVGFPDKFFWTTDAVGWPALNSTLLFFLQRWDNTHHNAREDSGSFFFFKSITSLANNRNRATQKTWESHSLKAKIVLKAGVDGAALNGFVRDPAQGVEMNRNAYKKWADQLSTVLSCAKCI